MSPIRVLIADDQALVRGALATLLGLESDLEVVAQVGRGDEVLDAVREHTVDVALVDIDMPGRDGLAATAEVVASGASCRCLIVTTFGRPGYLSRGMEAGAAGFIVKDTPPEALAEAIRKVHAGLRARCEQEGGSLTIISPLTHLTDSSGAGTTDSAGVTTGGTRLEVRLP